jgi:hypothetical protein
MKSPWTLLLYFLVVAAECRGGMCIFLDTLLNQSFLKIQITLEYCLLLDKDLIDLSYTFYELSRQKSRGKDSKERDRIKNIHPGQMWTVVSCFSNPSWKISSTLF